MSILPSKDGHVKVRQVLRSVRGDRWSAARDRQGRPCGVSREPDRRGIPHRSALLRPASSRIPALAQPVFNGKVVNELEVMII